MPQVNHLDRIVRPSRTVHSYFWWSPSHPSPGSHSSRGGSSAPLRGTPLIIANHEVSLCLEIPPPQNNPPTLNEIYEICDPAHSISAPEKIGGGISGVCKGNYVHFNVFYDIFGAKRRIVFLGGVVSRACHLASTQPEWHSVSTQPE